MKRFIVTLTITLLSLVTLTVTAFAGVEIGETLHYKKNGIRLTIHKAWCKGDDFVAGLEEKGWEVTRPELNPGDRVFFNHGDPTGEETDKEVFRSGILLRIKDQGSEDPMLWIFDLEKGHILKKQGVLKPKEGSISFDW